MAMPSEKALSLSNVVTPMRLSELVRTCDPTLSDRRGSDCFFSLSRSFTVPSTPPLKTMPDEVVELRFPNNDVAERQKTRYPREPSS